MAYSVSVKIYELSDKLLILKNKTKQKAPGKFKNYIKNLFNIPFSSKILQLQIQ